MSGWTWISVVCPCLSLLILGVQTVYLGRVLRRRLAYRWGWLEGRHAMIRSLVEAQRRGMDLDDWAVAEAERDLLDPWDYADE